MEKQSASSLPKWVITQAVKDCRNVEDFAYRYYQPDLFINRGIAQVKKILASLEADVKEKGYAVIKGHSSVSHRDVTFVPVTIHPEDIRTTFIVTLTASVALTPGIALSDLIGEFATTSTHQLTGSPNVKIINTELFNVWDDRIND